MGDFCPGQGTFVGRYIYVRRSGGSLEGCTDCLPSGPVEHSSCTIKKGAFTNRYEIFGFKVIESFSNEKNYFVKRNNAIHGIHLVEHIYTQIRA
jgi:hypothetical protein